MSSGDVRFVLNGPVSPDGEIAAFVHSHGDAVRDIAFRVSDAEQAFHVAVTRGAIPIAEPTVREVRGRRVVSASVAAFGDVIHSFVQRDDEEWWLPGFERVETPAGGTNIVSAVDHVAISVAHGHLAQQVDFYTNVLGFSPSHEEYVRTDQSAMSSKVVEAAGGTIRLPILEPADGRGQSQVDEYLRFNRGPGVQHTALASDNIIRTVDALKTGGVDFMATPLPYYETLLDRIGDLEEDVVALRGLDILVDRDAWGYLLQIFSKPLQARPTFFVEIIQRKGARGFGSGNIKALFEAVEREQRRRGNL